MVGAIGGFPPDPCPIALATGGEGLASWVSHCSAPLAFMGVGLPFGRAPVSATRFLFFAAKRLIGGGCRHAASALLSGCGLCKGKPCKATKKSTVGKDGETNFQNMFAHQL